MEALVEAGLTEALVDRIRSIAEIDAEISACAGLMRDRPALLRRLQRRLGLARLVDRQAVANALARACSAGRIPVPALGEPPPVSELREHARQSVAKLRDSAACSSDPLGFLSSIGIKRPETQALFLSMASSGGDVSLALSPAELCGALEALDEMHPTHARLLRDALELGHPRIAFWTSQMSERGTEVALYDYADLAETMLGATSYIIYDALNENNVPAMLDRFSARFGRRCVGIDYQIELDPSLADGDSEKGSGSILRREGITHLYTLKTGARGAPCIDGLRGHVRTLVHAVFDGREPHGDVYARISPCVPGSAMVVPHVVRLRDSDGPNMREALGIPPGATVFGRHGGQQTFDIAFVRAAVLEVAAARVDSIFFVFVNTARIAGDEELPNVIHLGQLLDEEHKARFIRTCDAMIHARTRGETFGLAVAEFSAHDRPVITSRQHHDGGLARFHLDVLGERGLYYDDQESLVRLLLEFDREEVHKKPRGYWNAYAPYQPATVMATFRKVFLLPLTHKRCED